MPSTLHHLGSPRIFPLTCRSALLFAGVVLLVVLNLSAFADDAPPVLPASTSIIKPVEHPHAALSPERACVAASATVQFTLTLPAKASGPVHWSVINSHGQPDPNAGTVSADGLFTAPAKPGVAYLLAMPANPSLAAMAKITILGGASESLFTQDFSADAAQTLTAATPDGLPDYFAQKSRHHPKPSHANEGQGLLPNQEIVAASGDIGSTGHNASHLDVVANPAAIFPNAPAANSLLLFDGSDWAMGYGVKFGPTISVGTLTVDFYDTGSAGQGLDIQLGDRWIKPADPRVVTAIVGVTLLQGKVHLPGGKTLPYAVNQPHSLLIHFDANDFAAGPKGSMSVSIDSGPAMTAPCNSAGYPDRLSLATGAAFRTCGVVLIQRISVAGIPASLYPDMAPSPIAVSADFSHPLRAISPYAYGVNCFQGFNPDLAANPNYQKGMTYLNAGLLRYHSWDILQDSTKSHSGWLNYETKTWDADKIKKALDAFCPNGQHMLMNIPGWPKWMKADEHGLLAPEEYDNFAQFCAALVKIVNVDQKRGVKYWELTNEMDGRYGVDLTRKKLPEQMATLAEIYNRAAIACKKVDPVILTGGPAVARSDLLDLDRVFVKAAVKNLDFYSYHIYVSGSPGDADAAVYDKTNAIGQFTKAIVAMLHQESPDRFIETHFNEYNISWTWQTRDPRMIDNKGAVFDALTMAQAVTNGATATNAWNAEDGIYGKLSPPDYTPRPGAHLMHLFNQSLRGSVVASASADPTQVVTYATRAPDGTAAIAAIALINRSSRVQLALPDFSAVNAPTGQATRSELSADGLATSTLVLADCTTAGLFLPPFSITVLSISH